jgi:hypothetical protein
MVTVEHVRKLMNGRYTDPVMLLTGRAVRILEIANLAGVEGWIIAVPDELHAGAECTEQWYAEIAAELSQRCGAHLFENWTGSACGGNGTVFRQWELHDLWRPAATIAGHTKQTAAMHLMRTARARVGIRATTAGIITQGRSVQPHQQALF